MPLIQLERSQAGSSASATASVYMGRRLRSTYVEFPVRHRAPAPAGRGAVGV